MTSILCSPQPCSSASRDQSPSAEINENQASVSGPSNIRNENKVIVTSPSRSKYSLITRTSSSDRFTSSKIVEEDEDCVTTSSSTSASASSCVMRIAGENGTSTNTQHQQPLGPLSPAGSSVASNSSAGKYTHEYIYTLYSTLPFS